MPPAAGDVADPPARVQPWPLAGWPALSAAVCLIAGILLHETLPPQVGLWLLTAACLATAALLTPRAWAASLCLSIALAAVGLAAAQLGRFHFAADHVAQFTGPEPRIANLELYLVDPPRLLRTADSAVPRPPKLSCVAEVVGVNTWAGWRATSGRRWCSLIPPAPTFGPATAFGSLACSNGRARR